ncbi:MAG TPA: hypothetical protein VFY75_07920 [Solirubrobacterales bacterium]|nr:hypothetical protein [Solirubrobacterales bacterium]
MLVSAAAAFALPSTASAASCPVTPGVFATAWIGGSGSLHNDANWSNGTPSGSCDVSIATPGSPVITMTGGANAKSFTLGGTGSTPQLIISDESPNTNLDAQPAGITIAAGASVTLTCQPGGCPGGGPDIYSGPSNFANAGTITVDSNTGGGAGVGGQITNTGTLKFEKTASLGGKVTNKGSLLVADGAIVTNQGSSCGDTGALVKNDTGGLIDGGATGVLSVRNFEQGAGTTKDVTMPCGGTLDYTGNGASEIRATGGFNLTGEMQAGQALTVSAEGSNTNAVLQSNFTNKGSITLTCPASPGTCSGGSGGGAGFNVNGKQFVNAGTFTVAADSGTGAGLDSGSGGTITNTGTMNFDQSAALRGVTVNQGKLNIADGKTATSPAESCGNTGPRVVNDTGGSINATGSGFLSVINYEQGNGTTSGTAPVQIPCGSLKYTGNGAGVVQVNGTVPLTGNLAAGQTLHVVGQVNVGTLANAGRIEGAGTISGTLENNGVVSPGSSPGTLTVSGNYIQGASGRLDVEIAGTTVGQFDALAVSGNATLAGTAALVLTGSYPTTLAIGDSVAFLTYGGSLAGGFGATTVTPALDCSKQMTVSNDAGAKALKATVSSAGCAGPPVVQPPVLTPPASPPAKKTCPKSKRLKKGRCVPKKCPKGKKLKKGRCVKKKQPKARSRRR